MNITKDIIGDLFPLYASDECSADTRALVEEYLRQHPAEAAELRRSLSALLPRAAPPAAGLDEMEALRKARRLVRRRSWLLGLAIFFSFTPFSCLHTTGHTYWLFRESPVAAAIYGGLGVVCWAVYFIVRKRSQIL